MGASAFLRRFPVRREGAQAYAPGVLEVAYERGRFAADRSSVARLAADIGAQAGRILDFPAAGRVVELLHVTPGHEGAALSRLRSSPLVGSASRDAVRYALSTNAASAFPNDPYFTGFAPNNVPALYETADSPGQWDMHVICAANAWAYGAPNSTGRTFSGALGGSAALAVIDTGADMTHPELAGRIAYSESDINGVATAGPVTDGDGHGTDVAGIAAASANNGIGFAGVAYRAPLMIFKVFPDPPCSGGCTALGSDIGLAINDAVAHHARVISMSLGSSTRDTVEETAVANAIAAGVVVVAAAGNDTSSTLDFPAGDAGVIAVGASALDDSGSSITESVASYSNYDAANPATWGVVAPGGDPAGSTDQDDLHWIENIYSSQVSDSSSFCTPDINSTGPPDCRVLIAGTSQAAPHVAGAASLLLSVGTLPGNVKNILCATATPIIGGKAGCGRLNVYEAMAQAVGDPSP